MSVSERRRQGLQWKSERSGDWNGKPGREADAQILRTGTGTTDRHRHRHHHHHGRRRHPHHRRDHRHRRRHHRRRHRRIHRRLDHRRPRHRQHCRQRREGVREIAVERCEAAERSIAALEHHRVRELVRRKSGGAAAEPGAAGAGRGEGEPCGGASLRRKERARAAPPPERRGPRRSAVRPASPGCRA